MAPLPIPRQKFPGTHYMSESRRMRNRTITEMRMKHPGRKISWYDVDAYLLAGWVKANKPRLGNAKAQAWANRIRA